MRFFEFIEIVKSEEAAIDFCIETRLLKREMTCSACGNAMKLCVGSFPDGRLWRCRKEGHTISLAFRKYSFFFGSHLSFRKMISIMYLWSEGFTVKKISRFVEIDDEIASDWSRFMREIILFYFQRHRLGEKIGGLGKVIEIDESLLSRREYNVGRLVSKIWVVGGIERSNDEFKYFVEIVPRRSADVLCDVILRHVEPGTTIITDEWLGYAKLSSLGFNHQTINHSRNFIDSSDPNINTQRIENVWWVSFEKAS